MVFCYKPSKKDKPPYNTSTKWIELLWAKIKWLKSDAIRFIRQSGDGQSFGLLKDLFIIAAKPFPMKVGGP